MNMEDPAKTHHDPVTKQASSVRAGGHARVPLFFSCPELAQSLDLLHHLVENTGLIPLVKGERGAGKTSLLTQFQRMAGDSWLLCRIDANPMLYPDQLLNQLAKSFEITGDDLTRRLEELRNEGRLPVLVIDDAHLLPVETLGQLLSLHQLHKDDPPLLRVVLFALPQIDGLLAAPELQANAHVVRPLQLPAFTLEQTRAFITHFFNAQGLAPSGLTPSQYDKVYRDSLGLPGRIEEQLLKSVRSGVVPEEVSLPPSPKLLGKAPLVLGGLGAVVLLLVVLALQERINALFEPDGSADESAVTERADVSQGVETAAAAPEARQMPLLADPEPEAEMPEPVQRLDGEEPPMLLADEAPVSDPAAPVPTEEPQKSSSDLVAIALPPPPLKDELSVPQSVSVEKAEAAAQEAAKAEAAAQEVARAKEAAAQEVARAEAAAQEAAKAETVVQAVPSDKGERVKSRRNEWLLQQDPEAYTWQLLGVREEASLQAFIKQHGLQDKAAYFQTVRQGRPWFALLYGVYPDRSAAIAARSKLPPSLVKKDAWLRQLRAVQEEIRSP
jgi:DamX protein